MTAEMGGSGADPLPPLDLGVHELWLVMADAVLATHGAACRAGDTPVLRSPEERGFVLELIAALHERHVIAQHDAERFAELFRRTGESPHLVAPDPRRTAAVLEAIERAARAVRPGG